MADMPRVWEASAEIALAAPDEMLKRICAHFREFGDVTMAGRCGKIDTGFGTADIEACDACLKVCAKARDDTALAYVKLALAEHLLNFSGDDKPRIAWRGDGVAGGPLPYFREMRVTRVENVTPRMRRLTLAGENLARFATGGMHVRLLFPKSRDKTPVWPVTGEDGRPAWPDAAERPDVRIYTARRVDAAAGEIDIDFVLHDGEGMPGACFAANARPGDVVGLTGPGGGTAAAADWYLLAGDETALPAIGRMLAELPANATAVVRIEVADAAEEQPLPSRATVDLAWLHRDGVPPGSAGLLEPAVRAVDWPADRKVFAWAGCEYRDFRAIRGYLRKERGLARDEHLVVAYWRRGFDGDNARKEDS